MWNNIILIGFMGSGKTNIGRRLAKKLGYVLLDTDSLIEANYGINICDFFKRFGEGAFREVEVDLCKWLEINTKNAIISTGGGMPTIYDVRNLGYVIYLDTPFAEIKKRVLNDGTNNRPMIKDIESLHALYQERLPIYQNAAHYSIGTLDSKESIVDNIYHHLKGIKEL